MIAPALSFNKRRRMENELKNDRSAGYMLVVMISAMLTVLVVMTKNDI